MSGQRRSARSARRRLAVLVTASCGLVPALLPAATAGAAAGSNGAPTGLATGLPARTVAQIEALSAAKQARTPVQRDIGSRLLAEAVQREGRRVAASVGRVATGVRVGAAGRTAVTVLGNPAGTVPAVQAVKGRVIDVADGGRTVRADVPLAAVQRLAAAPAVSGVQVADRPMLADGPAASAAPAVPAAPAGAAAAAVPAAGRVHSEGDVAHGAAAARARLHVSGVGVTVGVLSDGVDSLAAAIAAGELPAGTRALPGQAGSGDEGTAMLEIVHDLAPKARLLFATAFRSAGSFAANIRALRAAGADVIVDDVIYFAESSFQDGPIARAVLDVTHSGALYFSSAGNEGNVDVGTSGNWEGEYAPSGRTVGKFVGGAHDFAPGATVQALEPVSPDSAGTAAVLQWNDPLGRSGNDYDLYAVAADGSVLAYSNDTQDGNDDPVEMLDVPDGTVGLAVVRYRGAPRYLQLSDMRGRFAARAGLRAYTSPGITRGHSAVPGAISVAAAPAAAAYSAPLAPGVPNPAGPYPHAYTAGQLAEAFTSDGPRRVFYTPDGRALTPGNLTASGGRLRAKPDITAADGVRTAVPGFERFFGTSAAAPHAAALAALALSGSPHLGAAAVRRAMLATALDIQARGTDRDTGHGVVMAAPLLARTGATAQPFAVARAPVVTPRTGDGDRYLEPGESADLRLPVLDRGDAPARAVRVRFTSLTAGARITPASRVYPDIAANRTVTGAPFRLVLSRQLAPGTRVRLRVRVGFRGAFSPQQQTITLATGQPAARVTTVRYTGPPVPVPDNSRPGVVLRLRVHGVGLVSRATFSIDGTACTRAAGATTVGLDHTFVNDLAARLIAPDGTVVRLFSGVGEDGNNLCRTVFADSAARAIERATAADAPFTGRWRPAQPLRRLVGSRGDGVWRFGVVDRAGADVGSVRRFSVHLSGYLPAP